MLSVAGVSWKRGGHWAARAGSAVPSESCYDGRASYRQLAARTHWHESTVRRRVEELMAAGVLFFDLDLASDAFGLRSQALLWMSVAPR